MLDILSDIKLEHVKQLWLDKLSYNSMQLAENVSNF